jgi:hypothetical protein
MAIKKKLAKASRKDFKRMVDILKEESDKIQ